MICPCGGKLPDPGAYACHFALCSCGQAYTAGYQADGTFTWLPGIRKAHQLYDERLN